MPDIEVVATVMKRRRRVKWRRIGCGIGFCPLWWQWGGKIAADSNTQMFAVGPFRFVWGWK